MELRVLYFVSGVIFGICAVYAGAYAAAVHWLTHGVK